MTEPVFPIPFIAQLLLRPGLFLDISLTSYMFLVGGYLLWPELGHYLLGQQVVYIEVSHMKAELAFVQTRR